MTRRRGWRYRDRGRWTFGPIFVNWVRDGIATFPRPTTWGFKFGRWTRNITNGTDSIDTPGARRHPEAVPVSDGRLINEDVPRHGAADHLGTTIAVGPATRLYVALPQYGVSIMGNSLDVPFVLQLGNCALHMDRPELERLHDLCGRALAAEAGAS